jgi:hypothetical protein
MHGKDGCDHPRRPTGKSRVTRPAGRDVSDILALAAQIRKLNEQAAIEYAPIVESIVRSDNRDVRWIERTLEGLLDFCGHDPVVTLFRGLCRHYWDIG